MMILLLLIVFMVSCGGGGSYRNGSVGLSFQALVDAPYFSKVFVRVSGENIEPVELSKEGVFYPGDRVSFELKLPEGENMLFEAIVYDHQDNPVYYGSTVSDVPYEGELVINVFPTLAYVESYERFSNALVKSGELRFILLSEDLYSVNFSDTTGVEGEVESFLPGRYLAYWEKEDKLLYRLLDKVSDMDLEYEKLYNFTLSLPESSLGLSGSYVGDVFDGESLNISSGRLLEGGVAVVSAFGNDFYVNLEALERIDFQTPACGADNALCLPLRLSLVGLEGYTASVYGLKGGVRFRADWQNSFFKAPSLEYLFKGSGFWKNEVCAGEWVLWESLGEVFEGSFEAYVDRFTLSFELKEPAQVELSSQWVSFKGFCTGEKNILSLPYISGKQLGEGVFRISFQDGAFEGVVFDIWKENSINLPNYQVDKLDIVEEKEYILISFAKSKELEECLLIARFESFEIEVDRIPSQRSYLKIRKLWDRKEEKLSFLELTCFDRDRKFFAGKTLEFLEGGIAF